MILVYQSFRNGYTDQSSGKNRFIHAVTQIDKAPQHTCIYVIPLIPYCKIDFCQTFGKFEYLALHFYYFNLFINSVIGILVESFIYIG